MNIEIRIAVSVALTTLILGTAELYPLQVNNLIIIFLLLTSGDFTSMTCVDKINNNKKKIKVVFFLF